MFVKLCGLRTIDDARAAVTAEASALGFILAESRRQVTPSLVASVREELVAPPTIVGVTVNLGANEVQQVYRDARLDMVQLSGNEPITILDEIDVPVIKALKFRAGTNRDAAIAEVDAWFSHPNAPELVMIEGHQDGAFGGTGTKADWLLVSEIAVRYPIVLAGGLTPENVAGAIRLIQPIGVDAASGTETDGAKDPAKLTAFVKNAREGADW